MPNRFFSFVPFLLCTILAVLLLGFIWESHSLARLFMERIEREIAISTQMAALAVRDMLSDTSPEAIPDFLETRLTPLLDKSTRVTVLRADGTVLADTWEDPSVMANHADREEIVAFLKKYSDNQLAVLPCLTSQRYSTTVHQQMLYCITGFDSVHGRILVRTAVSVQAIDAVTTKIHRNVLGISLLAILLALIFGYVSFIRFSKSLVKLSHAARKIASGDASIRLPTLHSDSLQQLSQTIYDMSEQLQKKVLQLSHEKTIRDSIFGNLVEGIVLVDRSGRILEINRAAAEMLATREELAKNRALAAVWRDPAVETFFKDLTGKQPHRNVVHFAGDNKEISVIADASDFGILLVLYDRTRMKKLETYRRDFIANLSHEIKTPLTVIVGTVEALLDGAADDTVDAAAKRTQFLQTLASHAERLTRLLEDVLTLSNLECAPERDELKRETLPLAETVEVAIALCKPCATERQMTLEFVDKTDRAIWSFSPTLLEQAVVNLVNNAVKYSIQGDTIRIVLERDDREFRLVVQDHGRGIPLEHRERVFERFYRVEVSRDRQTGGTGLGLAIVKHIAQLHGGTASVEPTSPSGATFVLRFAVTEA
ncbi:MAG: sensor histidine kinase [Thermoguttaceae bacterium]